jgi:hypothetical protein
MHALTASESFSQAYASATPFFAPAKRAEISAVLDAARAESGRVIALAAGPRPGLFAPGAKKAAYKQLQDNASRAKSEEAGLGAIAQAANGASDLKRLADVMNQASAARGRLTQLYASSNGQAQLLH